MTRIRDLAVSAGMLLACLPLPANAGFYADPLGDAKAGGREQAATPIDIASMSVTFDQKDFFIVVVFNPDTPIAAPSSGKPNGVTGAIEFDIDRDPTTGVLAFNDELRRFIGEPLTGLGVEGGIDLLSEVDHPGFVDVIRDALTVATVPITYSPASLAITFPRSTFGRAGVVHFAAVVGDPTGPSDAAPSPFGVSSATAVPEPTSMIPMGTGLFALAGYTWHRRRRPGP